MVTRTVISYTGVLMLATGTLVAAQQTKVTEPDEAKSSERSSASVSTYRVANAVVKMLSRRVESVDWSETTFEDVLEWLRDQSDGQVNIVPRWGPLGVEGVTPESLVTLKLSNTTVADVLNEVLEVLSEDGEVRYHGIDNTLRISTKQDFGRKMYVRVYDVADMLFRVPNFGQGAPQIDLQKTQSGGQGGGGGQSVFSGGQGGGREQDDSGEQADQRMEEQFTKLKDSIQKVVAPESWEGPGGGRGKIEIINRMMVVSNTIEVHEMLTGGFSFDD